MLLIGVSRLKFYNTFLNLVVQPRKGFTIPSGHYYKLDDVSLGVIIFAILICNANKKITAG